jgi:uncharacterized protein (DUF1810 family)
VHPTHLDIPNKSVGDIFSYPDDLKFGSSMTLFAAAAQPGDESPSLFTQALTRFFNGKPDPRTMAVLK